MMSPEPQMIPTADEEVARLMATLSQDEQDHAARVAVYAVAIAEVLDYAEDSLADLKRAAILHDIGKIVCEGMPAPEYAARHTLAGEAILRVSPALAHLASSVRSHHENWDGSGYPDGLKSYSIPPFAKILRVAEAFDSMTYPMGWNRVRTREDALAELRLFAGKQFDATCVVALEQVESKISPVQFNQP